MIFQRFEELLVIAFCFRFIGDLVLLGICQPYLICVNLLECVACSQLAYRIELQLVLFDDFTRCVFGFAWRRRRVLIAQNHQVLHHLECTANRDIQLQQRLITFSHIVTFKNIKSWNCCFNSFLVIDLPSNRLYSRLFQVPSLQKRFFRQGLVFQAFGIHDLKVLKLFIHLQESQHNEHQLQINRIRHTALYAKCIFSPFSLQSIYWSKIC